MNDILLYGEIWQYSAMFFFEQVKDALKDDPSANLKLRVNTVGGSPEYMMSIIEKVQELSSQFVVSLGAQAHSAGLFLACYVDKENAECIDTTKSVLHRASFGEWLESKAFFKGSIYEEILVKTNRDLEKAFRARVDVAALEALPQMKDKNITLKDVFSHDARVEVLLGANDLKKIGLVSRINRITPAKIKQMASLTEAFSKCQSIQEFKLAAKATSANENPTNKDTNTLSNMTTLEQLKAENPALYNLAIAAGHKEGVDAERSRVKAWIAWASLVDPKEVSEGIAEGKAMTAELTSELTAKAAQRSQLEALKKNSNGGVDTSSSASADKTQAQKDIAAFEANLRSLVGLKPEEKK